MTNGTEKIPLI